MRRGLSPPLVSAVCSPLRVAHTVAHVHENTTRRQPRAAARRGPRVERVSSGESLSVVVVFDPAVREMPH